MFNVREGTKINSKFDTQYRKSNFGSTYVHSRTNESSTCIDVYPIHFSLIKRLFTLDSDFWRCFLLFNLWLRNDLRRENNNNQQIAIAIQLWKIEPKPTTNVSNAALILSFRFVERYFVDLNSIYFGFRSKIICETLFLMIPQTT